MSEKLYKANPGAAQAAAEEAAQANAQAEGENNTAEGGEEGKVYDADYKVEDDDKKE